MERKMRVTLVITAAALLAMLLLAAARQPQAQAVALRSTRAVAQNIYSSVYAPGEIEAAESCEYAAAHAATVTKLYVKAGDAVRAGQPLVRLRESELAVTDEAVRSFAAGAADGEFADAGALTDALQRAPADAEYTVTADKDGTVLRAPSDTGENVLPGLTYLKTADVSRLRVRADIPETYIGRVAEGQRANVVCDAAPTTTVAARVTTVAPYARRAASLTGQTQTATVEAVLDLIGAQTALRPGYTVSVKIFTDTIDDAVLVPYEAVAQEGTREIVFVVRGGVAHKLYVETGYELEGYIQIKAGIAAGDIVLVSPPADLKDGDRVEVCDA